MNIESLVTMTNDIAAFFHGAADPDEAVRDVAAHLRRFWEPRMRRQLLEHFRSGGAGLSELAYKAVEKLLRETGQQRGA